MAAQKRKHHLKKYIQSNRGFYNEYERKKI